MVLRANNAFAHLTEPQGKSCGAQPSKLRCKVVTSMMVFTGCSLEVVQSRTSLARRQFLKQRS